MGANTLKLNAKKTEALVEEGPPDLGLGQTLALDQDALPLKGAYS